MANNADDGASTSSAALPNLNLIKAGHLPEQWTLPTEWNIEKREMFVNWKLDVQSQIANLDKKLKDSLYQYPDETLHGTVYPLVEDDMDESQRLYLQAALRGKMQTGLRRA